MADPRTEPETIDVDRDESVTVTFADGFEARFDLETLRSACPCAGCRSRRDRGQPAWTPGRQPLEVVDASLVGAWGLGIAWNDGHSTGIYSWEVLRRWASHLGG